MNDYFDDVDDNNKNNWKNSSFDEDSIFNHYIEGFNWKKKEQENNVNEKKEIKEEQKFQNNIIREIKTKATYNKDYLIDEIENESKYKRESLNYIFPKNDKKKELKCSQKLLVKKRGRGGNGYGEHNKFSDDNLRRKCKHLILKSLFEFINKKIKEIYNEIGYGIFKKKLLIINQRQISNANIQFNRNLLNKSIGDIFSEDISTRYTNYPITHNKQLINSLKNNDNYNPQYFRDLFNLKFIDCLQHFRGSKYIKLLEGLKGFDSIKEKYEEDMNYNKSLKYYIMNFEEIINNKRIRRRKTIINDN